MTLKAKRFVMVLTDKGGTGKSMLARAIADRYRRQGTSALLVDADGEVGQLYQFYCAVDAEGDPIEQTPGNGVMTMRFTGTDKERDQLLSMLDHDAPVVLVDMPAASLTALTAFDAQVGFFDELQRSGYRATLINVLSPFQSSTRTVKEMINLAGDRADYVAVINRWFGDDEDFFMWFGDAQHEPSSGRALLTRFGGKEIDLPALQVGVLVAVDDLMVPFCAAVEHPGLSRPQRSRLLRWTRDTDDQLDRISSFIGLQAGNKGMP